MEKTIRKFLEFNGKSIYFLAIDGKYWIAIKPICDALGVNFDRQYKNLKSHSVFGQLYAKQPMTGADGKVYKMVCLPEQFIYGWLFTINSENASLAEYQRKCCEILFEHFHGAITGGRKELIREKALTREQVESLLHDLEANEQYQKTKELKERLKQIDKELKVIDKHIEREQLELFATIKK